MRIFIARILIKMAIRICVNGFTHDHLSSALKYETKF